MKTQKELHAMAVAAFRAIDEARTQEGKSDWFDFSGGICYNLDEYLQWKNCASTERKIIAGVKNHIVSIHPEFSGDTDYPVMVAGEGSALLQLECHPDNKWQGEYGAARVRMIKFGIEFLEQMDDAKIEEMFRYKTPFQRKGFTPDMVFVLKEDSGHLCAGDFIKLLRDDGSSCPYFIAIGETDDDARIFTYLDNVEPLDMSRIDLLAAVDEAKRAKTRMDELTAELEKIKGEFRKKSTILAVFGLKLI